MEDMVISLSNFYPCGDCASHLRTYIKAHPPTTTSQSSFSLWMCQMVRVFFFLVIACFASAESRRKQHNDVNERLGKPQFDCAKTDERWRDGPPNGSCDFL